MTRLHIAEFLAAQFVPNYGGAPYHGRGSNFRHAVETLQKAGF